MGSSAREEQAEVRRAASQAGRIQRLGARQEVERRLWGGVPRCSSRWHGIGRGRSRTVEPVRSERNSAQRGEDDERRGQPGRAF